MYFTRFNMKWWILFGLFAQISSSEVEHPDEMSCVTNLDCSRSLQDFWVDPKPECYNGTCTCDVGMCVHFTLGNWGNAKYYCGTCGSLGSSCDEQDCDSPGICQSDLFCHCIIGDVQYEICIHYEPVTTSRGSIILILVLIIILLIGRIIAWRRAIGRLLRLRSWSCTSWCFSHEELQRQNGRTTVDRGDNNGDKSAAFTISSREFMTTSNDSDLDWAIELSLQAQNIASIADDQNSHHGSQSIRSISTGRSTSINVSNIAAFSTYINDLTDPETQSIHGTSFSSTTNENLRRFTSLPPRLRRQNGMKRFRPAVDQQVTSSTTHELENPDVAAGNHDPPV